MENTGEHKEQERGSSPGVKPKDEKTTETEKASVESKESPLDRLKHLLADLSWAEQGVAYGLLKIAKASLEHGDGICDAMINELYSRIEPILQDPHRSSKPGLDFECDIAPILQWYALGVGFEAGARLTDDPMGQMPVKAVVDFLKSRGLEVSVEDSKDIAGGCLMGAEMAIRSKRRREKEAQAVQQKRAHRDSLPKAKKLNYVLKRLEERLSSCCPTYQEEQLLPVMAEKPRPPLNEVSHKSADWEYHRGVIEDILGGCDSSFRQKVVAEYQAKVLPELCSEYEAVIAREKATDEFVALTNDKSVEQIQAMTAKLS